MGTVVLERLVCELDGVRDDQFVVEPEKSQATAVTRMFGEPVTTLDDLSEAMARRAVRAAEKIREEGSVASWRLGSRTATAGKRTRRRRSGRAAWPMCRSRGDYSSPKEP